LVGQVVRAERAHRWNGDIWVVVVLPDGFPGRVRVGETDLAGDGEVGGLPGTTLSVEGVRALKESVVRLKGRLVGDAPK